MMRMRDRAVACRPIGDVLRHRRVVRVDRLDQPKPAGMRGTHLEGVAGIVAVQGE